MSDERPEALLKSALEKIVYFEARSKHLENDVAAATNEVERLKRELAQAGQREIELRRQAASFEVELGRAHRDREELGRMNEALRRERSVLLEQIIEASRIHASDGGDSDQAFDLAAFIAQLRAEALDASRGNTGSATASAAVTRAVVQSLEQAQVTQATQMAVVAEAASMKVGSTGREQVSSAAMASAVYAPISSSATGVVSASSSAAPSSAKAAVAVLEASPAPTPASAPAPMAPAPARASHNSVAAQAERLLSEGRLKVSYEELQRLTGTASFRGRTEETLFGFSVRELSAPDPAARVRAAERLRALAQSAAAPALAVALHAEREPQVQVALLAAFAELASKEGVPIVLPLLDATSAEVRIAALKALLALDPTEAGPHLSAAMKDADRSVRRRASLLALELAGTGALSMGEQALADSDPEVRSLGALVLGASGGDKARELLLGALRDPEKKVRKAAAQSLSRIVGEDVSAVVDLDEPQRRREVRRLAGLPLRPVRAVLPSKAPPPAPAPVPAAAPHAPSVSRAPAHGTAAVPSPVSGPAAVQAAPAPVQPPPSAAVAVAAPAPVASPQAFVRPQFPTQVESAAPSTEQATGAPDERGGGEMLCGAIAGELRASIRGRTLAELVSITGGDRVGVAEACELLVARGHAVRRGTKFFTA